MSSTLENKVAMVTGAASGLGLEIVRCLVREGAAVVMADVDGAALESAASALAQSGDVAHVVNDVRDADACAAAVNTAVEQFGRLDIAVNNAGIIGSMKPLHECSLDSWRQTQSINVDGVFYGMRAQVPVMLSQGSGVIINISSIAGKIATRSTADYVTSKHAVLGMTMAAALDYADQGLRINAVGPGLLETPMASSVIANSDEYLTRGLAECAAAHPMGRIGKPGEAAELVAWLCSDRASFCTGGYYPVNGGYLSH